MIVDSSALVSILSLEPEAERFLDMLRNASTCRISAGTYLEVCIVLDGKRIGAKLDALLSELGVVIEPVTETQARIARQAYAEFGKGRHKAGLNYGDCFAYALAKDMREPLLFKGTDFAATDVRVAV